MARCKILLITPFWDEGEMYAEYLQARGFDVVVHREPTTAVATAVNLGVQAIVARVRQRGPIDGIALTRSLRHGPGTEIAVVLLSTAIDPAVRKTALDADCDRFLLLPCLPAQVAEEVSAAIGERLSQSVMRNASVDR